MSALNMSASESLDYLAQQVRRGVRGAAERFVQVMQPQMERIARRTLRRGAGSSRQDQWILEEHRRVCQDPATAASLSREEIISRVAWGVCESMVWELQAGRSCQSALETVRG